MPPLTILLQLILMFALICSLATIKQKSSLAFSKAGVRRLASCLQRKTSCQDSNLWQCEKRNNTQRNVPAQTSSFNLKCVGKTVLLFLCVIQSSTQTPGRTGLSTPEGRSANYYYFLPPSNQTQVNVLRGGETTKRLSGTQKFTPPRKFVVCGPKTTSRKPTTEKATFKSKTCFPPSVSSGGALPPFQTPPAAKEKYRTMCDDKFLPQAKTCA